MRNDADVRRAGFHGYDGCPWLVLTECPTPYMCSEKGSCHSPPPRNVCPFNPECDWQDSGVHTCGPEDLMAEIARLRAEVDVWRQAAHGFPDPALAEARALLDAWCTAANDGEDLAPLRAQTLAWMEGS